MREAHEQVDSLIGKLATQANYDSRTEDEPLLLRDQLFELERGRTTLEDPVTSETNADNL